MRSIAWHVYPSRFALPSKLRTTQEDAAGVKAQAMATKENFAIELASESASVTRRGGGHLGYPRRMIAPAQRRWSPGVVVGGAIDAGIGIPEPEVACGARRRRARAARRRRAPRVVAGVVQIRAAPVRVGLGILWLERRPQPVRE